MKRLALALFPLFLAVIAAAQSTPGDLVANPEARTSISLNGSWRTIVDPFDVGSFLHVFANAKAKDKHDLIEYDFDSSPILSVPGDWNSQRKELLFYEGTVWYQKSFEYHKREHVRSFLYFEAAASRATVYLNGTKVGKQEGGYTPFNFEVTDLLHEGANFVVVEVNNSRRKDAVPSLSTDWWNYGGLTRGVAILELPETFIQDYFIQLAKGSQSEIAGWLRLNNAHAPQEVTLEIPEAGVKRTIRTDAHGYAEFRFGAKLTLWSPENPKLYRVSVSTEGDKVSDDIGFRTVETRGTQVLLNGKPIFLRGISVHEEAPYRGGRAFSDEDDTILLGWAKELGCNFVRLAHYPHNAGMTRLADHLGLLVWSEIPVYWDTEWDNPGTLENAREQLSENITRDHNRASVVLWSVANETSISEPRNKFLNNMVALARQLDNTRLIAAALNRVEYSAPATRTLNDPLGASLDVLGINEYIGWYEGTPEETERVTWKFAQEKPVIVSEFGAGAVAGLHGDSDTRWAEEYQSRVFAEQIKMVRRMPAVVGMSPWLLMDFRSPRRLLPGVQDYYNRKGVISDRGQRKSAFYVLQKFYKEKAAGTE